MSHADPIKVLGLLDDLDHQEAEISDLRAALAEAKRERNAAKQEVTRLEQWHAQMTDDRNALQAKLTAAQGAYIPTYLERLQGSTPASLEVEFAALRGEALDLRAALAERDAKLAALLTQEPTAYRFPKAGINNGYNYCESMDGEEPRFLKAWEKLYAAAGAVQSIPKGVRRKLLDELGAEWEGADGNEWDDAVITMVENYLAAGVAPTDDTATEWRRLALQFDGHRMQALQQLKCLLEHPKEQASFAASFLAAPPLSGEAVLAERIKALSGAAPVPAGKVLVPVRMTRAMQSVCEQDDWEWADVLAAANAVTESQYEDALEGAAPIQPDDDDILTLAYMSGYSKGKFAGAAPAPDMFWNNDDAEQQYGSIDELLNDEICNGNLEVGDICTVQRGVKCPNIDIRVISIDDEASEAKWEIVSVAATQGSAS